MKLRAPWETEQDRVAVRKYEIAVKQIEDREQRLDDVRRYLIPMTSWGLDDHLRGHIEIMLKISDYRREALL